LVFLISAALLVLGGIYVEQSDLVRAGLILLAIGVAFVPGAIRRSWIMQVALCALAIVGIFYALIT
jgi:hypothetical protein